MHTDKRGTIKDLLVTDEYSITYITFNEGAVRGNHFHNETKQVDVVLKGVLLCKTDEIIKEIGQGDSHIHYAGTPHAYQAITDSELLSICFGKRRGEHYEEDTFRLPENEKLL